MIARELLVKLGFDIDNTKLNKFVSMVEDTKKKMNSFKQEVADSISPEINTRFNELKAEYDEKRSWTKHERADVLALNRIEKQAIKEVSSLEATRAKEKQKQLANLKKSFGNLSRNMAIISAAVGAGFGLSLRSTLKDVENYKTQRNTGERKTSSTFTDDQIAAANDFNSSLAATKNTLAEVRNTVVLGLLPAINKFLKPLNEWIKENKVLIQQRLQSIFKGLANVFLAVASIVSKVAGVFATLIEKTVGWKFAISAIVGMATVAWFASLIGPIMGVASAVKNAALAFRALSLAMRANPIVLIITGIIAVFALLADEIYVTVQGGDSLTNRFLKSTAWQWCRDRIDDVKKALSDLYEAAVKAWDKLANLADFKGVKDFTANIGAKISDTFSLKEKAKYSVSEGNIKAFRLPQELPKYTPNDLQSSSLVNNHSKNISNNVTQKNSFNMSITVPVGTSQEQASHISTLVQRELSKYTEYQNEKWLNNVGAY